jgi:hypothetical protein
MQRLDDGIENARIADNLRRGIELTELALALLQSILLQGNSREDSMAEVMPDIRWAKELAWRQAPSSGTLEAHLKFLPSAE